MSNTKCNAQPGKVLVVKYGGRAMINAELMAAVAEDLVLLGKANVQVVLVHGGSSDIEKLLELYGIESKFINGLRYTSAQAMEVVQMVLCGKVNKNICALIQSKGGEAVGLCGIDGGLLQAKRAAEADLGFVGNITKVNTAFLRSLIDARIIPVISPVALGIDEDAGHSLNINADTAAAKIAAELHAEELVLMTDICGILRNLHDPSSLITSIHAGELDMLKAEGSIGSGMIPKVDGCISAIQCGVKKVRIIDGRIPHVLQKGFCQGNYSGTLVAA